MDLVYESSMDVNVPYFRRTRYKSWPGVHLRCASGHVRMIPDTDCKIRGANLTLSIAGLHTGFLLSFTIYL